MYIDKFGFIHKPAIDYMKELDRLYKKAFPNDKDNDKPKQQPINEVKKFHKLINDNDNAATKTDF